jgi:hypothetical protein
MLTILSQYDKNKEKCNSLEIFQFPMYNKIFSASKCKFYFETKRKAKQQICIIQTFPFDTVTGKILRAKLHYKEKVSKGKFDKKTVADWIRYVTTKSTFTKNS